MFCPHWSGITTSQIIHVHIHVQATETELQYPSIKSSRKVNVVRPIYAAYNAPYRSKLLYVHHVDRVVLRVHRYGTQRRLIINQKTLSMGVVTDHYTFKHSPYCFPTVNEASFWYLWLSQKVFCLTK